jgi:LmbE family N-acetylglucosaminyl deacetylase
VVGSGGPPERRRRRVLAFVAAHPDDDVMGVAGIVALRRDDPEFRFVLAHATDGAAGEIAPGSGATRSTLGAVRRDEDARGWAAIGRSPDHHEWWGHDDGELGELDPAVLERRAAALLERERPDVVLTFGPDGLTGHPDHIAVGAATTKAFVRLASAGSGPGLHRLLHGAYPRSAFERENARRVASGRPAWDPARVYEPRWVPDERIACTVDQRAVVPLIRAAFAEHRTQWVPPWTELDERGWVSAAGENHLVQAWPPWQPGTPRLTDPFAGS